MSLESKEYFDGISNRVWPKPENDVVPPGENYDIYRYDFPTRLADLGWSEAAKVFVRLGIMAPSSHNMQAWRFFLSEKMKTLRVEPDDRYIGGPSDLSGRQAVVGVGTCTENIVMGMKAYGLNVGMRFVESSGGGRSLMGVEFDLSQVLEGELVNSQLINLMKTRRVYRGPFDRRQPMPATFWSKMQGLVDIEGVRVVYKTDRLTKVALGLVQYAADNVVLQNLAFRKELGGFMASNDTLERRVMPGNTFGLFNDNDAALLREQLADGGRLRGAFAAGFPQADKDAIISADAVVVVVVDEDKPDYWLKAGGVMEKIWLFAQANGLGVGVMAGMVEVTAKAQEMLTVLGVRGTPAAVMRVGVPLVANWPRSPRVKIDEVISG